MVREHRGHAPPLPAGPIAAESFLPFGRGKEAASISEAASVLVSMRVDYSVAAAASTNRSQMRSMKSKYESVPSWAPQ